MNLFVISLFLFSNCVLIQTRVSNLPQILKARKNYRNSGECPCFPKPHLDNNRLEDQNIERLVVYLYKNINSNEIEVFTPNPEIQKLIPNFRYGNSIKTVTTETIASLFHHPGNEITDSDEEDEPIGLLPGKVETFSVKPEFFETEHDDPHENCGFDAANHQKIVFGEQTSPNIETKEDISFDKWFHQQIEALQNVHLQNIHIEVLRSQVQKTLADNDMAINPSGFITDLSGVPINLDNLKLRPILIGDAYTNQQISEVVDNHIPYLEGVIVTLADPPKVLNVIDLGKTYITKTSPAITPETHVFDSIRHYETGLKGLLSKSTQTFDSAQSSSKRAKRSASSYSDSYYQYPQSSSANHWHQSSHNWQSHFNPASTEFHSHRPPYWGSSTSFENIWPASYSRRKKRSASYSESYYPYSQSSSSAYHWHAPSNQGHSHYPSTYYPQSSHSNSNWQSHSHLSPSWGSSTPYENIWSSSYSGRKKRSAHSSLDSYYPYSQSNSVNHWHEPNNQWHSQSYPSTYYPQSAHSNPYWQPHSHGSPSWGSSCTSNWCPSTYDNIWPASYSGRKKRSASHSESYYPYSQSSSSAYHWHAPSNQGHSHYPSTYYPQSSHSNSNWQSHSLSSPSWGSSTSYDNIWPASYSGRKKRSVHSSLDSYYPYSQSSSVNHWHEPNNQWHSQFYPSTYYPQRSHSSSNWQSYSHWSPPWGERKKRSVHSYFDSYYPHSYSSTTTQWYEPSNQKHSHSHIHSNPNWQSHSHQSPSWGSSSWSLTPYKNWSAYSSGRKKRSAYSSFLYPKGSSEIYRPIHSSHPSMKSPISLRPNSNWQHQSYTVNPGLTESHTHWSPYPPTPEQAENSGPVISNPYPPPNINIWPAYQSYEIKFEPHIVLVKDTTDSDLETENVTHPTSEQDTKDTNGNAGDSNGSTDSEHTDLNDNGNKQLATEPSNDLPDIDTIKSVIEIFLDNMSQTLIKNDGKHNKGQKSGSTRKSGDPEEIEIPDFRIIGGSAATGSGSPVSNKGRSGVVVK